MNGTCSWTSSKSELSSSIKIGTAPASITVFVCMDVPDAMLVSAQAASNYRCAKNHRIKSLRNSLYIYLALTPELVFERYCHHYWYHSLFFSPPSGTNFTIINFKYYITYITRCSAVFAKLTCSVQFTLFFKNSTNLSTTPGVFITSSIGGLGSEINRYLSQFCVLLFGP